MFENHYTLLDEAKTVKQGFYKNFFYVVSLFCIFVLYFTLIQMNNERIKIDNKRTEDKGRIEDKTEEKGSQVFQAFHDCFYPKLEPLKGKYEEFWHAFTNLTVECDNLEEYNALEIRTALNGDEVKYVALPKQNESLTMVTLGIGHDVSAEIELKKLHPNTNFFGADPASDINRDLYENKLGGSYYKYAVSGESGLYKSRVFEKKGYEEEIIEHIRADYFFKHILHKTKIDILWIDIEGNEYPILDQLRRNGALVKEGFKICQVNVELHKGRFGSSAIDMEQFHDFAWKVLEEKKYIMMKPFFVTSRSFIRTFIVNVSDKECTELYLS